MRRKDHSFQFVGRAIEDAALIEAKYHLARVLFWDREYETAVAAIKVSGVTVREYDVTNGRQAQVVLDGTGQERLNLAMAKRDGHRKEAEKLRIEAATYGSQPDRAYELDADDVMHFRLAGGEREE